ncbi:MAG: tetratricopeptide repeat protein [Prevotellaceae bacterium]|nr:tetratricopeptide repeat protein [Prevotellaceae bacterium]
MKISQTVKTTLGIASLFIFGLLFGKLLDLTNTKDLAEQSRTLFGKGLEAAEKGNYRESVEILSKSIKLDSTNIEARNCLGKTLLRMEKYAEAIERLNVTTVDAKTLTIRGDAYFALENYSAAFADYSESLKISPNASAYAGLGNVFVKMNNIPEGINNYTKAIELKSDCADYYFVRGKTFNRQGKYEEAINDFNIALKIEPDNAVYKQNKEFTEKILTY